MLIISLIIGFDLSTANANDRERSDTGASTNGEVNNSEDKQEAPRRPSRYSVIRKQKLTKVTDVVQSYPNVSNYLQQNQIAADKLSYSDLEKVLNDMKFQSLNSTRQPTSVTSLNAPAEQGPSCLPQMVKVKSGDGSLENLAIKTPMNHNQEMSYPCTQLTGASNVFGSVNLKCNNTAITVIQPSSCSVGGCSTTYSGFSSGVDTNVVNDIILSNSPSSDRAVISKSCSELYQGRNIANVRGTANFTCSTNGWQATNNCEIRACDNSYTFTINNAYYPTDSRGRHYKNGDVGKSYDLSAYGNDGCVTGNSIKSVSFSFRAANCGTRTPTVRVAQGGSIATGDIDPGGRYRSVSATLNGSILNIGLSQRSYSSNSNILSICYPVITVELN